MELLFGLLRAAAMQVYVWLLRYATYTRKAKPFASRSPSSVEAKPGLHPQTIKPYTIWWGI